MQRKNILSAYFLGGVKLLWCDRLLTNFATQKVLGLFCYLLDNAELAISRDKLIAIFWGESPENQARYNLRHALWNIRKLFKDQEPLEPDDPVLPVQPTHGDLDPLITTRTTCQINPDFQYIADCRQMLDDLGDHDDQTRHKSLGRAIRRYKGQFLDGFTIRNLPQWEEWLHHRREEFRYHFLNAAVELGYYYLQTGAADRAIEPFMKALTVAPDFESAHEGIIHAYAEQGKTSAALRQYDYYVEAMKRDFDAPPTEEITALAESLRQGRYVRTGKRTDGPAQTVPQIESTRTSSAGVSTEPPPPTTRSGSAGPIYAETTFLPTTTEETVFIGREKELQVFQPIIREVIAGRGQALIISGEMGIGKTRLFEEAMKQLRKPDHPAASDFFIGLGESQEIASAQPIAELIQAVEMIGRDPRLHNPDHPAASELRVELQNLLDQQRRIDREDESSPDDDPNLLKLLHQWIIKLAHHAPVLIALDDMHWASEAVLKLFAALTVDVKYLPLLIVGIFRTFELQSEDEIASALISAARTGRLWRIELGNFSSEETKQLITVKADRIASKLHDHDWEQLYRFSSGIPLYAIELANFLREGKCELLESPAVDDQPDFTLSSGKDVVPPLMKRISALRLGKLPRDYVKLLRTASLILGNFCIELIHKLLPVGLDHLEEMLIDLEHRNFLHHIEDGNRLLFGFNHQMIKLAIMDAIPLLERRRIHKAIITALEESAIEIGSDAKAYYLYNAGERDKAVPYLLISARLWLGYGDIQKGLDYSQLAYKTAMEPFDDQRETVHQDHQVEIMGKIALIHADNLLKLGMVKSAIDVYNDVISIIETHRTADSDDLLARRDELRELLRQEPVEPDYSRRFGSSGPLVLVSMKRALANVKLLQGDMDTAFKLFSQAEQVLDSLPNSPQTIRETGMVLQVKAKLRMKNRLFPEAAVLLENALELLKRNGVLTEISETYRLLASVYRQQGYLNKADEVLQRCQELCTDPGDPARAALSIELAYCLHERGILSFAQERYDEAEKYLRYTLELSRDDVELVSQRPIINYNLAKILYAGGKTEEAQQLAKESKQALRKLEISKSEGRFLLQHIQLSTIS